MDRAPGYSSDLRLLASCWTESVARAIEGCTEVSVLYSGGLDSSLVAWGVRGHAETELVSVGVKGSSDLIAAEQGAQLLALPWTHRTVGRPDVERLLAMEHATLASASEVSRPVLLGLGFALESANHARVLCGQGADELFLGYAHFDGLSSADAEAQRRKDLDRLLGDDWPLTLSLATRVHKDLRSPFLDREFLSLARALPIDQLRSGTARKSVLREMAVALGLPPELAGRSKKAFQYGSGIAKLLRATAHRS